MDVSLLMALGLAAAAAAAPAPVHDRSADEPRYAQVVIRSHIVIRVRTGPATPAPSLQSMFREKKGPRCIPLGDLAGAAVIAPNSVDLAMRNGTRLRARFASSCPALDYYSGFYLVPNPDGMLCADRDVVRDRAGGECAVDRIRALQPRK